MFIRKRQCLLVLAALLVVVLAGYISTVLAEEYYFNNFEDNDDVNFRSCGPPGIWDDLEKAQNEGYFSLDSKGISGEKAYSGVRSLKLDVTLNKGKRCYFQGPKMEMIPLDKSIYLSGYILPTEIPKDIEVKLGWLIWGKRNGKYQGGAITIDEMVKVDRGWIFQQTDIYKAMKNWHRWNKGWDIKGMYLKNWYISIRSKEEFHGQKVVFYIDDVRVMSEEEKFNVRAGGPYVVKSMSYFRDRPKNPHNLVDNSSFELGMKNWVVSDKGLTITNWEIDNTTTFHGKKSLKIYRIDSSTKVDLTSQVMPIKEGESYTLSAYLKANSPAEVTVAGTSFHIGNIWKRCVVPIHNIERFKLSSDSWSSSSTGYSILITHTGKETIWVDAVQLEKGVVAPYELPSSVELGLSTSKMTNIYYPGEPVFLSVNLFNASGETVSPEVTYKVNDFRREIVTQGKLNFLLNKNEGKTKEIKFPSQKGYFKFSAVLEPKKNLSRKKAEISLGVIFPLFNKDVGEDCFFGGSCSSGWGLLAHMGEEAGAKYQTNYGSFYWQYAPKEWKKSELKTGYDYLFPLYKKHHIITVGLLYGTPSWSGLKVQHMTILNPEKITDEVIQGWEDWTYAVVKKYKDKMKYWEVWIEFIHSPYDVYAEMYMRFLKSAYTAIKKADPEAIVIGCGEDTAWKWSLVSQVEEVFKLGGLDYMDAVSIHPYCVPLSPEDIDYGGMIDRLKEIIKKYNNGKEKDIWVTEVGWKGVDIFYHELLYRHRDYLKFVTELAQAEYIVRMNVISLAKGIKHFLTYLLPARRPHPVISPFALIRYDFSPKIAYVAYNAMVNNLRGAKFEREIDIGENILCYHFNKGDRPMVVIWNYDRSHKPVDLRVNLNPENVELTNMAGTPLFPKKVKEGLLLTLTGSPLYIEGKEIKGQLFSKAFSEARIEKAKDLTLNASWGKEDKTLIVTLKNQTAKSLNGKVDIEVPEGWQSSILSRQYKSLNPGEEKRLKFFFKEITFNPLTDSITIKATSEEEVLITNFKPLPCFYTENPPIIDGKLNDWTNIMPAELGKSQLTDNRKPLVWKGKDDLSAKVYTLWDKDYFYLGVEVNDDIFSNPFTGKMIWANDALQVAFDTLNDAQGEDLYDLNDYEFNISLTRNGPEVNRLARKELKLIKVKDVKVAIKREEGKIYYEIAFPWSSLKPFHPDLRRDIGFNLTVMDNDGDEIKYKAYKGFKQSLEISPGIVMGKQPALFRDLVFIE